MTVSLTMVPSLAGTKSDNFQVACIFD